MVIVCDLTKRHRSIRRGAEGSAIRAINLMLPANEVALFLCDIEPGLPDVTSNLRVKYIVELSNAQ
jgi:hypothetical protein